MLLFPPRRLAVDLISCGGNDDAGYWGKDIEEAVGQVGERGDVEDRRLCHAAGAPGYEHGRNGAGVLDASAQQAWLIALALVDLAEHAGIEHNGEELVGGGGVEENT